MKLNPHSVRRAHDQLCRGNLAVFTRGAFRQLHDEPYEDNWHIHAICHRVGEMFDGKHRRSIISMPPRTMKSFIGSVCAPAWILGRNPSAKIICASYAQDLSANFAFEMRRLMQTDFYRRVFPNTHLDPKKTSTEEVRTTRGGYRLSTSVGGTLTGRGGDFIVIDDPIKAKDAYSEVARDGAYDWYRNTVTSRLNNPKTGCILVIAQRLHMEDLPGRLLDAGGWDELVLPLVVDREQYIEVAPMRQVERPAGNILHDARFSDETISRLRAEMGEQDFEAQYNQRPLPPGGAIFKLAWLQRFDERPPPYQVQGIFQSWDTAYELNDHNDYSVCSTWALSGRKCYLLDIYRERLSFPELEKAVLALRAKWRADLVIVEKAGAGISLYQNLRYQRHNWIYDLKPVGSKQDRASQQSPKLERGEIWVPRQAPWLKTFEDELARFPHARHDDQVDSIVQFLAAVDTGKLLTEADFAKRR